MSPKQESHYTPTPQHQTQSQSDPQSQYNPQPQYSQQQQYNQHPIGVRIEIRTNPQPYGDAAPEGKSPNAVYVTQPLVFQHPGPGAAVNQQKQAVNNQGAKVIPVQIEGSDTRSPATVR